MFLKIATALTGLFVCLFSLPSLLEARPEYALHQGMSCNFCHVVPWGAGPRNIYGKIYGSRNLGIAETSKSDLFYADFRALGSFPRKKITKSSNGLGLMSTSVSANVPVLAQPDEPNLKALVTYDLGVFSPGLREAVFIWDLKSSSKILPSSLTFGRFYVPFGLLTDEHRSYTRMQTNTTLRSYEMGAVLSGDPSPSVHYDFAFTNGFQSEGRLTSQDVTFASTSNLRWSPPGSPVFLGSSFSYHVTKMRGANPYAASAYTGLSFAKITNNKVKANILGEAVVARYWNNSAINPWVNQYFIPPEQADFETAVKEKQSLGLTSQFIYDLFETFALVYKFDSLAFNNGFLDDSFMRHGFGFRYQFLSNAVLHTRYEKAHVLRPGFGDLSSKATQDLFWFQLRLWI